LIQVGFFCVRPALIILQQATAARLKMFFHLFYIQALFLIFIFSVFFGRFGMVRAFIVGDGKHFLIKNPVNII